MQYRQIVTYHSVIVLARLETVYYADSSKNMTGTFVFERYCDPSEEVRKQKDEDLLMKTAGVFQAQSLQTDVKIRGLRMSDWEDVADIFLAPKCQWGTLQMPYQSDDQLRHRIEQMSQKGNSLVAAVEQKVVGTISLEIYGGRRSHVGYLGMAVHDDYQSQGIGSQLLKAMIELAENWLNLKRLELYVYCDNEVAIALYHKYGFLKEGTLRKFAFRNGTYIDAYLMARVS